MHEAFRWPRLRITSKESEYIQESIRLIVITGTLQERAWFYMVKSWAVDILLGTTFFDHCIDAIILKDRKVLTIPSARIPTLCLDIELFKLLTILSQEISIIGMFKHESTLAAKQLTIPTERKPALIVVMSRIGLMIIEPIQTEKRKNRVPPARGIYQLRRNVQFRILVANLSKWYVTVHENMLNQVFTELSETITACEKLTFSSKTEINKVQ